MTINSSNQGHKLEHRHSVASVALTVGTSLSTPTHSSEEANEDENADEAVDVFDSFPEDDDLDVTTLGSVWEADGWSYMTGSGGLVKRAPASRIIFGHSHSNYAREREFGVMLEI